MARVSAALFSRSRSFKRDFSTSNVHEILRRVDAVCFDVDSTVINEEGIDMLAEFCGVGDEVSQLTSNAMNGSVKFEDALSARLSIINPSRDTIDSCLRRHQPTFTNGIQELVSYLHGIGVDVYLVSGGFRLMIEPIAERLSIPQSRVFANTIIFNEDGTYQNFDSAEYTSRDGGKKTALERIKQDNGYSTLLMIGDGVTDMQAKAQGAADAFIGYGGVTTRDAVFKGADWFIKDFSELKNSIQAHRES